MKKWFVQQTVKFKKFVHRTGRKMGLICLFLCLFLVRSEKKVCTGKKIIAPPNVSSGPSLNNVLFGKQALVCL